MVGNRSCGGLCLRGGGAVFSMQALPLWCVLTRHPATRHVGRDAVGPPRLGCPASKDRDVRCPELAAVGAHAHRVYRPGTVFRGGVPGVFSSFSHPLLFCRCGQILGNNEAFEPFTSNIYSRRTLSGDFVVVNKYMMTDLMKLGLWTPAMKNEIIADKGSIQNIASIPADLKELYKTVWEMKMKVGRRAGK